MADFSFELFGFYQFDYHYLVLSTPNANIFYSVHYNYIRVNI